MIPTYEIPFYFLFLDSNLSNTIQFRLILNVIRIFITSLQIFFYLSLSHHTQVTPKELKSAEQARLIKKNQRQLENIDVRKQEASQLIYELLSEKPDLKPVQVEPTKLTESLAWWQRPFNTSRKFPRRYNASPRKAWGNDDEMMEHYYDDGINYYDDEELLPSARYTERNSTHILSPNRENMVHRGTDRPQVTRDKVVEHRAPRPYTELVHVQKPESTRQNRMRPHVDSRTQKIPAMTQTSESRLSTTGTVRERQKIYGKNSRCYLYIFDCFGLICFLQRCMALGTS